MLSLLMDSITVAWTADPQSWVVQDYGQNAFDSKALDSSPLSTRRRLSLLTGPV